MSSAPRPARIRVLGGEVDLVSPRDVLAFIDAAAQAHRGAVIANHNAHSLFLIRRSPELRRFFDGADLIQIDSRPLIAWARLVGLPATPAMRSTYLDWRDAFWSLADQRAWRVFYLGGAPGVASAAADRLARRFTRAALATHHGYFDKSAGSSESAAALAAVADFDPHVLMVGMGMPEQELWTLRNTAPLRRQVILTVGAAFDYEAGAQPTPPRWTGKAGVEWLARLASQPRRLAWRYLVEPWSLIGPALEDIGAALGRPRPG
jgi:N-acetylglucosaminyldiphosphoundecaprenol N-acetyl-beta-D-mannosaminyltransferase